MTDDLRDELARAVEAGMAHARADLEDLVAFRSVANPEIEPAEECHRAAALVAALFNDVGLDGVEQLPAPDGSTAVVGRTPGPEGAPTVLLYSHYDVVPAGDPAAWSTPPWELTEVGGRWFGRGAADCKGNLVASLLALRAVEEVCGRWPVGVAVLCEGSEEQSSGGTEALIRERPDLVQCDALVLADTGNIERGVPTVTTSLRGTGSVLVTVRTMDRPAHSGMYGGAAPDALQALLMALASLRDETGETTVDGLDHDGTWQGAALDPQRLREDAGLLEGVDPLCGRGAGVADMLWARPAATVLAIDCPPVSQVTAAVQGHRACGRQPARRRARRLRRGAAPPHRAPRAPHPLRRPGRRAVPLSLGQPFESRTDGPAHQALARSMRAAFGRDMVTTGQGGSIPLATALAEVVPDAEILLVGVEEPACHIHAPNESVNPDELRRTALTLALLVADLGGLLAEE